MVLWCVIGVVNCVYVCVYYDEVMMIVVYCVVYVEVMGGGVMGWLGLV